MSEMPTLFTLPSHYLKNVTLPLLQQASMSGYIMALIRNYFLLYKAKIIYMRYMMRDARYSAASHIYHAGYILLS